MKTGYRMKTTSRRDYLQKIHQRYGRAGKEEKRRILDEFCNNCGYHRKYATACSMVRRRTESPKGGHADGVGPATERK